MAGRIGFGYDVHRLVPGRPLVLGGVQIPSEAGLDGHSDADVLLHAIADALLGACALGDIGKHFPNTDPQYRNISSLILLGRVGEMLREAHYSIVNIDTTLVLEHPKILSYIDQMRAAIASALKLKPGQVSVKATTSEAMGFVGRSEGASAYAVAAVEAH